MGESYRAAWAEVDLAALAHNVELIARLVAPARLCAVVKADGYGHGAVRIAEAALAAGAAELAVALVEEGLALRAAGITAPVLVLSEQSPAALAAAVDAGLTPTLYTAGGIAATAAAAIGRHRRVGVELKVDTGMHRVGCDPADAGHLATSILAAEGLTLAGLWSHLAVADEVGDPFTELQLDAFGAIRADLARAGIVAARHHVANSAGAIAYPAARLDLVRVGLALYGQLPAAHLASSLTAGGGRTAALRPVLSLKARVHFVRRLSAGERPSYGRRQALERDSVVATIPLGYADGVTRAWGEAGGVVLIGGRRRPILGSVTMDQLLVDCGPDESVRAGDEVVLIGRQGDEEITATEWAEATHTIAYEVLCGIGPRVPRQVVA